MKRHASRAKPFSDYGGMHSDGYREGGGGGGYSPVFGRPL